ncbi:MarR family transcriptional regulator [Leisingera daeponensis]|uniref:MarR family transcriptional regulator n=1 Tax=Leisingera daeponensis TaxID=405746 RepID=A0ABS7NNH2_9RHOB|nr:MarR family transcriptional regulator [Leisingera daeponensis]MBY6142224.1 MarR family transcriptional regulator [Leisingera daeponensis]
MNTTEQIRALINRLARLDAAETWEADLNPAQIAALEYLARANRFSRAPSHVAEFLGTTRGTMSQTLKSLVRKGYLTERRSENDRRSITYDLTVPGVALADRRGVLLGAIGVLPDREQQHLCERLSQILTARLAANGGRAFGICKTCAHHRATGDGAYCALLSLPLTPEETTQLCHEQVTA